MTQLSPQEHHEAYSREAKCNFRYFANGVTVNIR